MLRSFGLISRNANPYREDPAGPEVPVPAAQLLGRAIDALRAHAARRLVGRRRGRRDRRAIPAPALVVRGTGPARTGCDRGGRLTDGDRPVRQSGLAIEGDGVVLTALRRRGEWLELRLVAETARPHRGRRSAGRFDEARDADLLGRPIGSLAAEPGALHVALGTVGDPDDPPAPVLNTLPGTARRHRDRDATQR